MLQFFIAEVNARTAADLTGLNRRTVTLYDHKIGRVIADPLVLHAKEVLGGEVELDESYFGGVRKGKRGRGEAGKVVVFGILKRGGKVYTQVLQNTKTTTLPECTSCKTRAISTCYSPAISCVCPSG